MHGRLPTIQVGDIYGRLIVMADAGNMQLRAVSHLGIPRYQRAYIVLCECGTEKVIRGWDLVKPTRHVKSCGCLESAQERQ